jgi:HPt (histidine-containing phosphotransfer) domain-containing protein
MPIIMFGDAWDQERILDGCREAGIAGYLPKPISIARLVTSIHDCIQRPQCEPGVAPTMPKSRAFELERLTSFSDGDQQLERELTSLYLATAGVYLDEMRRSLSGGGGWGKAAHALKGASANIGAAAVAQLAEEAEQGGPSTDRVARLDLALNDVRTFLRQRSEDLPSPRPVRRAG